MTSVDGIISSLRAIDAQSLASDDDRHRVLEGLRSALRRIQTPWDIAWDQAWVHDTTMAAIKTLIGAAVFTKWAETGSQLMTVPRLADLTGADPLLLRRLLRQIAAEHLVTEIDEDTYASTPWSLRIGTDYAFSTIYEYYHDVFNPICMSLPLFLKKARYENPTNLVGSNFQQVHGEQSFLFGSISSNQIANLQFADTMSCQSKGIYTSWVELYDTSQIIQAARPDRPLVVNVCGGSGGQGHDIEKFLQKHPDIPKDRFILQDKEEVLEKFTTHPGITACPYDLFTPQPVKGARIYYFYAVFHGWPDNNAVTILKYARDAMEPGYSKLLIHEVLVSAKQPPLTATTLDLTMMSLFSSSERSEEEWRRLISSVQGLQVARIWKARHAVDCIIEIERV